MADQFKFVQAQTFTLAGSGAILAATSITLNDFTQIDGSTALTMTDFGSIGFGTLEPNNSTQEEQICFTGVTANANGTYTLTGVSTVLTVSPYTQTSGLAKAHPGGAKFVISNTAGFYDKFTSKSDDETITGLWDFPNGANTPTLGASYVAPTAQTQVASKGYADALAIAGAPNASTTVQGLVQIPRQSSIDHRDTTGSTGALYAVTPDKQRTVLTTDYVADTGTKSAYAISPTPAVTQYTVGMTFTFKATNANAAGVTLNVNSLGAKPLRAQKVNLRPEYIRTNYVVGVVYTGTDFEVLSASAQVQTSQDGQEIYGTSTTGNTAYVVGLVPAISKYVAGQAIRFKPDTGGGHATLNVNSLGAKNVFKYKSGTAQAVETGDIMANQIAVVVYDGTQFLLQNQLSSTPQQTSGTTTKNSGDASATQTIAHGLGRTPKWVRIKGISTFVAASNTWAVAEAVYNGTTQSAISTYNINSTIADASFTLNSTATTGTTTGTITFDYTNIYIAWLKSGSPTGTYTILWEAVA